MKDRCITGIFILLCCLPFAKLFAQADESQYYTFQKDSAAYITLDTSKMMSANQGDVWVEDTTFNIPIGFNFFFLDHQLTQLGINQTNLFMPQRDHYIAAFGNFLMEDVGNYFGGNVSLSPISYVVDSSKGPDSKVLKIQWLNAGYFFDSLMFLNVQIWLYQGSNMIEIRYGKSNVNLNKSQVFGCGPLVGLAKVDTVKRVDLYEMYLNGNEHNPDTIGLNQNGKRCLDNVPNSGIIYRFIYHDRLGIAPPEHGGFSIYPNPVSTFININLSENKPSQIEITDITGRRIKTENISTSSRVDTTGLQNGIYFAKMTQAGNEYMQKFIVNR